MVVVKVPRKKNPNLFDITFLQGELLPGIYEQKVNKCSTYSTTRAERLVNA